MNRSGFNEGDLVTIKYVRTKYPDSLADYAPRPWCEKKSAVFKVLKKDAQGLRCRVGVPPEGGKEFRPLPCWYSVKWFAPVPASYYERRIKVVDFFPAGRSDIASFFK